MAFLEVGSPAPDFKGLNVLGGEFALDNVKGKKAIVLTFASDQVNPAQVSWVKNLYEKNRADVEMISLVRQLPSVSMAKAFLQQLGIKFPIVYDQKQKVFELYGVEQPVVIFAINKQGIIVDIRQVEPKALNQSVIQEAIAKAKGMVTGGHDDA